MKISYNWLKDYVDIKLAPEQLAATLTMAGATVDSVWKNGDDHILEIEVTANRPDWLSYIGVARELAALTGAKLKVPVTRPQGHKATRSKVVVKVEEKRLCPRYTARIIKNVRVGESPAWLKTRIEAMGLRPVNNIVDITNFCLFETGEPMHAFDLDRLEGKTVVVRKSRNSERITTIDGTARTLDGETLVIADNSKPIAIAGVMGGLNTEVKASTKNILLEAAYFDPISVRRTARKLALMSESSYRFERKVDICNIDRYSDRALALILELGGGEAEEFIDIGDKKSAKKTITLKLKKLNAVLGIEIPGKKVKSILSALGVKIKSSSAGNIKAEPPSFRHDINSEIDLIEEVARVYGYDKIPETIPMVVEQPLRRSPEAALEDKIRQSLVGLGCDEIISYSLLSKNIIRAQGIPDANIIDIKNPLSAEQEAMRPSLAAGMLNAILWNINRKTKDLKLFELGNVYTKNENNKFTEKKHLSIAIAGDISNWMSGSRRASFFDLKGIVETLFAELGIGGASYKYEKDELFSSSACASVEVKGEKIGVIGEIGRKILNNFDIKEPVYLCEICAGSILRATDLEKHFKELARYPSVYRDISIVVEKNVLNGDIAALIKDTAGPVLKETSLVDRYIGKQIPEGKVSLSYRLEYQDPNKTLEEKEILEVHTRILRTLEEKFGARLR